MALTKIPASLLDTSSGLDLSGNITLGDNERIQFGDGTDLQIYHNGTNSFIKDTSSNLVLNSDSLLASNGANTQNMIVASNGGAVTLFYAGATKLATSSTGATVTGVLTATSVNTGQGDYELYAMDQNVRTTDSPAFAAATINGTLTVTGDLDITGNINSYNVTDLDVTDQTITLGAGQTEANSGGSGIIVDGSGASILWDETNTEWDFNTRINVPSVFSQYYSIRESGTQYGFIGQYKTIAGTGTDTSLSIFSETGDGINFLVNGSVTKAVVIDSSGNATFTGTISSGAITTTTNASGYALIIEENSGGEQYQIGTDQYGGLNFFNSGTKIAEFTDSSELQLLDGGSPNTVKAKISPIGDSYFTGGNIGIGTSTPQTILNVQGTSSSSYTGSGPGDRLRVSQGSAGSWIASDFNGAFAYIGVENASIGKFAAYNYATSTEMDMTLGQDRLYIKNNGKVGIGTTNPNSILHINSSFNDTWVDINGPASQYTGLKLFRGNGDWSSIAHNHFGLVVSDIGLEVSRFTGTNATGRSQIMVFDGTNERVGINMNSPAYDLDVNGTFAFRSTGYAYGTPMYWYNGSSYLKIDNPSGVSIGEIGMVGSTLDLRLQSDGGNTRVGGHMIMENSGDYYQVTGASGTAWTISGGGQIAGAGSSTPGTGSTAFGIHHWNGSAWDNPLTIVGGTGDNAHNVKIGRTTSSLAEARKLNVYSDSSNNDGIHTINYNGANTYQCAYHMMTGASSTIYAHIETSISTQSNIMFRAHFTGYNYGTASVIDMHGVGYAYQPQNAVISAQTVNNGGDANQELVYYTSNNNRVVLRFKVGNSAYYTGFILHMEFAQPTGYNHDFTIVNASWTSSSANQY